jgi:hypothetical protein
MPHYYFDLKDGTRLRDHNGLTYQTIRQPSHTRGSLQMTSCQKPPRTPSFMCPSFAMMGNRCRKFPSDKRKNPPGEKAGGLQ